MLVVHVSTLNKTYLFIYYTQDEEKQNKNTTQYVLNATICKQKQIK